MVLYDLSARRCLSDVLGVEFGKKNEPAEGWQRNLETELVQVAAVCVAMLQDIRFLKLKGLGGIQ